MQKIPCAADEVATERATFNANVAGKIGNTYFGLHL